MKKIITLFMLIVINLFGQTYKDDSLIVQAIIDLNNLTNVKVEDISDSMNGRIWNIDIYNSNISVLPENIGNLTSLFEIDIDGHQLKKLPDSFWNISALIEINFSNGTLEHISDKIDNLSELECLFLVRNKLITLPLSIINLTKIDHKNLNITYNHLCNLPEEIVKWVDEHHNGEDWLSTQTDVKIINILKNNIAMTHHKEGIYIYNLLGKRMVNNSTHTLKLSTGLYVLINNKITQKYLNRIK